MFLKITKYVVDGQNPCFRSQLEKLIHSSPALDQYPFTKEEAQVNSTESVPELQKQI